MGFDAPCARPLSGGLPGGRRGTPPPQAPPLHPATDRSGSVPSWVKSERRMADIGILSTVNDKNPHPEEPCGFAWRPEGRGIPAGSAIAAHATLVLRDAAPSGSAPQD